MTKIKQIGQGKGHFRLIKG